MAVKNDLTIQSDVLEQLKCEPFLNTSEIIVSVKDGIVALSGHVDAYSKKAFAEKAAKKVAGVKAVAEDIHVEMSPWHRKSDTEIAQAALNSLKWNTIIPDEQIKIRVEDGNVKLEGEVEWEYQRVQAKSAIENLSGVRTVINLITVKPKFTPMDIQQKIKAAFERSATVDAGKIITEIIGSKVILSGEVRSFAEKEDAENAAWSAPGVLTVESRLEIEEPEFEEYSNHPD